MKAITVQEAGSQLSQLVAAACRGEFIVLTDGDKQVAVEPRAVLDLEEDSPELEAALLRAVNGPHAPLTEDELQDLAADARRQLRVRSQI